LDKGGGGRRENTLERFLRVIIKKWVLVVGVRVVASVSRLLNSSELCQLPEVVGGKARRKEATRKTKT
jgi:hypothetical protein